MYDQLTNEEKMVVNSEVSNNKKGVGIAYLLWFFLGTLGIHRFYLNRKGSAIAMLSLTILGWLTAIFAIGFLFLIIVGIWELVDLFLVGKMVREENDKLVTYYSDQILRTRSLAV